MEKLNSKKELKRLAMILASYGVYKDTMHTFIWDPNKTVSIDKDFGNFKDLVLTSWS